MSSDRTAISDQPGIRALFPCAHHAITTQSAPQSETHPIPLFRTMPPRNLTPTEYRIFTQLVRGFDAKDISAQFQLALPTVKSCCASIRKKTDARNFVALAARYVPREPKLAALRDNLTPRQQQIVDLIAQQLTNQKIAATLGMKPNVAKTQIQNIRNRTGLRRVDLVHLARPPRQQQRVFIIRRNP